MRSFLDRSFCIRFQKQNDSSRSNPFGFWNLFSTQKHFSEVECSRAGEKCLTQFDVQKVLQNDRLPICLPAYPWPKFTYLDSYLPTDLPPDLST